MGTPEYSDRVLEELEKLSFEELRIARRETERLAITTFCETKYGFENALGRPISVEWYRNSFVLWGVSAYFKDAEEYLRTHPNSILLGGSQDESEVRAAARAMFGEIGYRVIK